LQPRDWEEIAKDDPFDLDGRLSGEATEEARGF
jgi:hypothetical protein